MREELKQKLLKHINFVEAEIGDYPKFKTLTWKEYSDDRDKRRNVERWTENIINSSIDIAKAILILEGKNLPDNYKEIVLAVSTIKELEIDSADQLSRWVKFRNILAHEYLDIKWTSIKKFIAETEPLYRTFLDKAKEYLEIKIAEDQKK